jgi:hypothetical protein
VGVIAGIRYRMTDKSKGTSKSNRKVKKTKAKSRFPSGMTNEGEGFGGQRLSRLSVTGIGRAFGYPKTGGLRGE